MKYFIDTEFIEGFHKPLFGKCRHFIDLISIGIVCEDGREYYAISNEFNPKDADKWVKENVIAKLEKRYKKHFDERDVFNPQIHLEDLWKSNEQIKKELLEFFGCWQDDFYYRSPENIEVYAYYADYDWVVFCSLFGRMIDLPKGFPMYCKDLKQTMDENADYLLAVQKNLNDGFCKETGLFLLKNKIGFPRQKEEHNALYDARWNFELYKFLQTI